MFHFVLLRSIQHGPSLCRSVNYIVSQHHSCRSFLGCLFTRRLPSFFLIIVCLHHHHVSTCWSIRKYQETLSQVWSQGLHFFGPNEVLPSNDLLQNISSSLSPRESWFLSHLVFKNYAACTSYLSMQEEGDLKRAEDFITCGRKDFAMAGGENWSKGKR